MDELAQNREAAARQLARTLLAMGQRRTNPVLLILAEPDHMLAETRYPPGGLSLGGGGMRTYYHSHAEPAARPGEHGHFHIFLALDEVIEAAEASDPDTQTESDRWIHLAGLGMDEEGQPLDWFATNQWVTGGPWREASDMLDLLRRRLPATAAETELLGNWLGSMLGLYQDELADLLRERDAHCAGLQEQAGADDVRYNQDYYELARRPVQLLGKLQTVLQLA